MRRLAALALLLALIAPAGAQEVIVGKAVVLSADTLVIGNQRVRLWGIAAPAVDAWPWGAWAREALTALAGETAWRCVVAGRAPPGSEAVVRCDAVSDPIAFGGPVWTALRNLRLELYAAGAIDGADLGMAMLLSGWALADRAVTMADPALDQAYELAEAAAAAARRGLWRDWKP